MVRTDGAGGGGDLGLEGSLDWLQLLPGDLGLEGQGSILDHMARRPALETRPRPSPSGTLRLHVTVPSVNTRLTLNG